MTIRQIAFPTKRRTQNSPRPQTVAAIEMIVGADATLRSSIDHFAAKRFVRGFERSTVDRVSYRASNLRAKREEIVNKNVQQCTMAISLLRLIL